MSSSAILPPDAASPRYPDSIRAALRGLALGDALGYPLELLSQQEITEAYPFDQEDFAREVLAPGATVSDDTQLSLYLLDALNEVLEWNNAGSAADELACMWLALLRWYRTTGNPLPENAPYSLDREIDSYAELKHLRGPGKATLRALASGEMQMMEKNINPKALGTGALVRSLVLGFLPVEDAATVVGLASRSAALTHGHPEAIVSACAAALLMRASLGARGGGAPLASAVDSVIAWLETLPVPSLPEPTGHTLAALKAARAASSKLKGFPLDQASLKEHFGENGWLAPAVLGQAVAVALAWEQDGAESALGALAAASAVDGDSDSVAAITGALLGAAYGSEVLPGHLVEKIDLLPVIAHVEENWLKQLGIS